MERWYGFRITRICNARRASTSTGIARLELIAGLELGSRKCPVEGESVLVKYTRAAPNQVAREIVRRPGELCESPCPLCGAKIQPSSGFTVALINPEVVRIAEARKEKVLGLT